MKKEETELADLDLHVKDTGRISRDRKETAALPLLTPEELVEVMREAHVHPWEEYQYYGVEPHRSQIVNGPYHLRKYSRAKDIIVPSGPQASIGNSFFNLSNTILGSGILTIPITFAWTGAIFQPILLTITLVIMYFAAYILLKAGDISQTVSYEDVVKKAFGKKSGKFVDTVVFVRNFLTLAAYLVLLGDFGTHITSMIWKVEDRHTTILILGGLLCLPLSLLPNMNSLRFTSLMAMVFILFFAVVVVAKSSMHINDNGVDDPVYFKFDGTFWRALPLAVNAYACHVNIFPIYAELKDKSLKRGNYVLIMSFVFSWVIFLFVGLFGYLQFTGNTDGDVLNNYRGSRGIIIAVLLAFIFVIVSSYPLMSFTCRLSLGNLIWRDKKDKVWRGWILSTGLFIGATIIALITDDVTVVIGFAGSIGTALITMILPGAVYFKLTNDTEKPLWLSFDRLSAVAVAILGIIIGVLGLVFNIIDLI